MRSSPDGSTLQYRARGTPPRQFSKMADRGRLTLEQKVKTVLLYAETKSVAETQRRFRAHFRTRWSPCRQTVYRLTTTFQTDGSVLEKKRPRAAPVRTAENIEAVRVALARSPSKSTRRASAELGISRRSLQRILHADLKLFPYKITVVHKLMENDKVRRLQFATSEIANDDAVIHNTWFSDEVYVHLNGSVNKQNVRFWAREVPEVLHETDNYGEKVSVWCAISSHGIIGPFFFNDTVNSARYMDMLENTFLPQLYTTRLPMETQWFMQDGARPHTANVVLDFLHEHFGHRVMSNRFPERFQEGSIWPPHSPDINPCDFFLWGHLKETIHRNRPHNLMQLRADITTFIQGITEELCRKVVGNLTVRLEEVVRQQGGHIEHVLHAG